MHLQAAPLLDRIVFAKVGAALGGRLRCVTSGGAPLAPHIEEFMRVALPFYFSQGYGLTETCAASFFSSSAEWVRFFPAVPSANIQASLALQAHAAHCWNTLRVLLMPIGTRKARVICKVLAL